jgi:hypothetical protein
MSDQDQPVGRKPLVVDKTALVPIGVLVAALWFSWFAFGFLDSIQDEQVALSVKQDQMGVQLVELRADFATFVNGAWSMRDQRAWVALLRAQNPTLMVPPVD